MHGCRGLGYVFTTICLCVLFPHDISKTDAARITKLGIQMSYDESLKSIYFGVIGHESQKQCWRGSLHSCKCWLLLIVI